MHNSMIARVSCDKQMGQYYFLAYYICDVFLIQLSHRPRVKCQHCFRISTCQWLSISYISSHQLIINIVLILSNLINEPILVEVVHSSLHCQLFKSMRKSVLWMIKCQYRRLFTDDSKRCCSSSFHSQDFLVDRIYLYQNRNIVSSFVNDENRSLTAFILIFRWPSS